MSANVASTSSSCYPASMALALRLLAQDTFLPIRHPLLSSIKPNIARSRRTIPIHRVVVPRAGGHLRCLIDIVVCTVAISNAG